MKYYMKFLFILIILSGSVVVMASDTPSAVDEPIKPQLATSFLGAAPIDIDAEEFSEIKPDLVTLESEDSDISMDRAPFSIKITAFPTKKNESRSKEELIQSMWEFENERIKKGLDKPKDDSYEEPFDSEGEEYTRGKFHWFPAIVESLLFVGTQHGVRFTQEKTRRELPGPFFRDWFDSVKNLGGWHDGDSSFTNYVAHPSQGSLTARIFLNNSEKSQALEFGKSKDYWKSRAKSMLWAAVWSTQFELGPISEANIGNVGLYDDVGPNKMGWVDMVMTPTLGTGFLILEDIIDKYVLKNWIEKKKISGDRRVVLRMFITPIWSLSNALAGRKPWHRWDR